MTGHAHQTPAQIRASLKHPVIDGDGHWVEYDPVFAERMRKVGGDIAADGFLIALPYSTRADWVRNVLAAGSATIVSEGQSVDVGEPIIAATAEAAGQLPARTLRTLSIFGVTECLHLQRLADGLG